MAFFDTIKSIDRRIIFLIVGLSVALPLLLHIAFTEKASPIVQKIFDRIESLPPGSRILVSFDYGPSSAPEIQPMAEAVLRHATQKNLKIYLMALWATGHNIIITTMETILIREFPPKKYGIDYVNLGYKAGNQGLINVIVADLKKMYTTDAAGTEINTIPMMTEIRSLKNFDLIVSLSGGFPGIKEWILFAGDPAHIPITGGCTAVTAPLLYPYYPKQLLGLMGGLKGAAEYESALAHQYPQYRSKAKDFPGIRLMGPQAVAHVVIMLFVILGNITFFIERSRQKKKSRI